MPRHWEHRDKKIEKRKTGMRRSGDSVFVIRDAQRKRDEKLTKDREKKTMRVSTW